MVGFYIISGIILLCLIFYLLKREKHYRQRFERVYYEDILKFIFHLNERELPASMDGLKGALSLSTQHLYQLVDQLKEKGLVRLTSAGIELEKEGRQVVLQIIRAHRLWETYLRRETELPLHQIHKNAESKEHELRGSRLEALNAHLGFPTTDPHGDPIPTSDGQMKKEAVTSLADWPVGKQAMINHIEDEPYKLSKKLFKLGLRPNQVVHILSRTEEKIQIQVGDKRHSINIFEALNIQVKEFISGLQVIQRSLLDLRAQESAIVLGLSPEVQGLARRRLLDLGITPGVRISKALISSFAGDPIAYSIRGAKIALRKEQARNIYIEKI